MSKMVSAVVAVFKRGFSEFVLKLAFWQVQD
jgi:hypothetical protein